MSTVKRMKRVRFTPDELQAMLHTHLQFEIKRFRFTLAVWLYHESTGQKYGWAADQVVMESCLLHTRLLLDFFYPRPGTMTNTRYKDVFVWDYLSEEQLTPGFRNLLLQTPTWLGDYRNKLDQQLAHLTLDRRRRPPWNSRDLVYLESLIAEFINAVVPPEKRSDFDQEKD